MSNLSAILRLPNDLRCRPFYGFVALISVALLYSYRTQIKPWLYLLYGFGSLFLMGLAIRAMLLG